MQPLQQANQQAMQRAHQAAQQAQMQGILATQQNQRQLQTQHAQAARKMAPGQGSRTFLSVVFGLLIVLTLVLFITMVLK